MIRIVVENIFFFLLPTLAYLAWYAYQHNEWPGFGHVLRAAPLITLFVAGAVLMLTTLVLFSSRSQNSPHDVYVPPEVIDGKLQPGHRVPTPPSKP